MLFKTRHFLSTASVLWKRVNMNVEVLPVNKTVLGEGPHWDASKQQLYYVDILAKAIHRYDPSTNKEFKVTIDNVGPGYDSVSLVIPVLSKPNQFIIGHGASLAAMEWDGKSALPISVKQIVNAEGRTPGGRFNDGKCDPSGRLWAGTLGRETKPGRFEAKQGVFYKLDTNGALVEYFDKIDIANGLAWSPDQKTFYYIDTLTYRVDAFDYDKESGTISNRRPAFDLKKNNVEGLPDGMCIDENGNLWVALFDGKKIIHVDPKTGKLLDTIHLPASKITSCCFGGPNLDILYVTSAKHGMTPEQLKEEPEAGSVFKVTNIGVKGLSGGVPYAGSF